MKRKSIITRGISLIASTALLLGTLSGCSLGDKGGSSLVDEAAKGSKDYVFKSEKLDITDASDYSNISIVGDRIYAATYSDGENITICSFNSDGSDIKTVKIPEADSESHGDMTYDKDGNMYCILYKYYYTDDQGNIVDFEEHLDEEGMGDGADTEDGAESGDGEGSGEEIIVTEEEAPADSDVIVDKMVVGGDEMEEDYNYHEEQYLLKFDASGNELLNIMLSDGQDEDNYFSLYGMIYDDTHGLILSSNRGIQKFNEEDQSFTTIAETGESSDEYGGSSITLYSGFNGQIFASLWGDHGIELRSFDPETGKLSDPSEQFKTYDDYAFFGGNGYDLYVSKTDGFYGYDKGKDTLTKILDFVDSDISITYSVSSVVAVSDQEFIANFPDESYNYSLYRLTKVPTDQVKDKTIITLAGSSIDYNVRDMVYKFNQDSDDYKIKIVDYSTLNSEDDWQAGLTQFNLDIVSGNVPDIMYFVNDEPIDSYINKGLFLDLSSYLASDPELKDVEFVENAFEAFKTGDKMYQVVPSFYVNTLAAKTSNMAGLDTLTLKDCKEMIQQKGVSYSDSFGMTAKDTIMYYGLISSGNKFVDWENKSCNFNSDGFIELLEFAKEFPDEITEDMWMDYDEACYRTGNALFSIVYLNGFRPYKRYVDGTFGSDISLIGFPNEMGVNCSILTPNARFAVSAQTKYPEECWKLIRQLYLDEYQDTIEYDFPIRKDKYDALAKKSMEKEFWIDDDGEKHYEEEYYWIGDTQVEVKPLTQKDVDTVKDFVESLTLTYSPNQEVSNIVNEEAAAYFKGQKTAAEVAEIIQSRVSIFVNENS